MAYVYLLFVILRCTPHDEVDRRRQQLTRIGSIENGAKKSSESIVTDNDTSQ